MSEDLKTFLTLIIGASLPLLGQYIGEYLKRKGERLKFSFEKIINVGEEFYKFSGLALIRFESTLNLLENIDQYSNSEALKVFADVECKTTELCQKIASSTITITTANIYYKVSDVKTATKALAEITKSMADFYEIDKTDNKVNNDKRREALLEIKSKVFSLVQTIKTDRTNIEEKIKKLMGIN